MNKVFYEMRDMQRERKLSIGLVAFGAFNLLFAFFYKMNPTIVVFGIVFMLCGGFHRSIEVTDREIISTNQLFTFKSRTVIGFEQIKYLEVENPSPANRPDLELRFKQGNQVFKGVFSRRDVKEIMEIIKEDFPNVRMTLGKPRRKKLFM